MAPIRATRTRVSAVDALVDVKLLKFAHQKFGAKKAGLMLISNPWGQGNEKGLRSAAKADPSVEIVGVEKFENNDVDMVPQLTRLKRRRRRQHHPGGQRAAGS